MGLNNRIAAYWGLLEACCFFIVPDVWLSRLAMNKSRNLYKAIAAAIAGALVGGSLMYWIGQEAYLFGIQILDAIPAIDWEMIGK